MDSIWTGTLSVGITPEFGVETNLVVYANDGHVITSHDNQIDLQNRVLAWFDAHLK